MRGVEHHVTVVATCDRCRLEWDVEDFETVEFTELEERWCSSCRGELPTVELLGKYECARCTCAPENYDELSYWFTNGDFGPEFYEDGTFGGFCPACAEFMESDR